MRAQQKKKRNSFKSYKPFLLENVFFFWCRPCFAFTFIAIQAAKTYIYTGSENIHIYVYSIRRRMSKGKNKMGNFSLFFHHFPFLLHAILFFYIFKMEMLSFFFWAGTEIRAQKKNGKC